MCTSDDKFRIFYPGPINFVFNGRGINYMYIYGPNEIKDLER